MNDYIQENKRAVILLTVVLFLLTIVLYYFLLRPQMIDLSNKRDDVEAMEEQLRELEQKITSYQENGLDIEVEQLLLEKKVPTERKLDEYIISLQRLESITDSKIEKIEFVYDSNFEIDEETSEGTEEGSEDTEENSEENEAEDVLEENENDESEDEINVDPVILNEKPEELQIITVKLTAISPDFEDFIKLLELIENDERISIVTNLQFNKLTEDDIFLVENPLDIIPFEAELTTFYYAE